MLSTVPQSLDLTYPQVLRIIAEELTTLPPKYYQILVFIAARTYRFGKKEERMPLTHFTDGIETNSGWIQQPVGMTKNSISTALLELETAGLITVTKCRNNVKKIGLSITTLTEGVEEMVSRLRHGKAGKTKKVTPTVSQDLGNQYPTNWETSIPKFGTPNIRSRNKDLRSNNGAEALVNSVEEAKSKSRAKQKSKMDRQPKHKQALSLFRKLAKESCPTLNLSSPSAAAIRNMRLATEGLSLPEAKAFAEYVATNWETFIVNNLSYLHKKDPNLHIAPCANTFGMLAAKFLESYQREQLKGERHSEVPVRRAKPALSLVRDEAPKKERTVRRVQTKREKLESQGIDYKEPIKVDVTEKVKAMNESFDAEVRALMESSGMDYEAAADAIAFGD